MSLEGPPWLVADQDGNIVWDAVPERLLHNSDLRQRGIVLNHALKPGTVFRDIVHGGPGHVVKALDLNTEELSIYERLLRDVECPMNHTLPCEIVRAEHPLLIMPLLGTLNNRIYAESLTLRSHFRIFYELIEGVEYLHSMRIAHLDIAMGNVLFAYPSAAKYYDAVKPGRVYVIDFDTARQFALGPGFQKAITLPETQAEPPRGITSFDPYSWDIYCLGRLFEYYLSTCYRYKGERTPWISKWYSRWLIGEEKGCLNACNCRPTARTARRVLGVLRFISPLFKLYECGRRWLLPASPCHRRAQ
ncbi:hypothetical protein C8Q78DRAFT_1000409 [Trametes maxima]|nr:hypothetical protein C8Q78DRAFT_1000409 [Trametes maxima]